MPLARSQSWIARRAYLVAGIPSRTVIVRNLARSSASSRKVVGSRAMHAYIVMQRNASLENNLLSRVI